MTVRDRVRWDRYYRSLSDFAYPDPDPLLYDYTPPVLIHGQRERPRALDLACGVGQNGIWLATQGYSVDLLDISREALHIAQLQAMMLQARTVNFMQVDLDEVALKPEAYDLVIVFRYMRRELFPRLHECVRPGGRVIYATFNMNYLDHKPDFNTEYLLYPGELSGYFTDWHVLHDRDAAYTSEIVAIKPENT
jgi:2-polyprenyl-3-methyl-5-hydroxy-6-metoxy-1,4-benzoquinol methylase